MASAVITMLPQDANSAGSRINVPNKVCRRGFILNQIRGHRSDGEVEFAAKERTRQLVIGRFHDMQPGPVPIAALSRTRELGFDGSWCTRCSPDQKSLSCKS